METVLIGIIQTVHVFQKVLLAHSLLEDVVKVITGTLIAVVVKVNQLARLLRQDVVRESIGTPIHVHVKPIVTPLRMDVEEIAIGITGRVSVNLAATVPILRADVVKIIIGIHIIVPVNLTKMLLLLLLVIRQLQDVVITLIGITIHAIVKYTQQAILAQSQKAVVEQGGTGMTLFVVADQTMMMKHIIHQSIILPMSMIKIQTDFLMSHQRELSVLKIFSPRRNLKDLDL